MSGVTPAWTLRRPLGARGPLVTGLGLGCAPIGNLFAEVSRDHAIATVDAAWDAGIRYFDTAPLYGHGLSERRLGAALRARPRDQFALSTKVGRLLRPADASAPATIFSGVDDLMPVFDFSHDGVLRSLEESLVRLGTDHVDVVLVHDPGDHEDAALVGAFPTVLRLREEGVVRAVGCGMTYAAALDRFVERVELDCVLLAGRYSLLDRSGSERLLPHCAERGGGVILGGVFNSGVLIDPDAQTSYDYAPASEGVLARARRLRDLCEFRGVALPAAALQFAMSHPAVTTVVVGARSPGEVVDDVRHASVEIPAALWAALGPGPPSHAD